jgi:hypothetical protein
MARIYANLIEKDLKTLNQVPLKIRSDVEQILKEDGYRIKEDKNHERN